MTSCIFRICVTMLPAICAYLLWLVCSQGCSLGLDVSVSRRSRDAFSKRLGLVSVSRQAALAVQRFTARVTAISDWMSASRLKINPTKTEVLWLGSSHQLSQISITDIPFQSTTIRVAESARNLGVVIDSKLSLSARVQPSVALVSTTCANSAQCSDH